MFIQRDAVSPNTLIGGVDFGPVWGMSGVQGFDGEGYKFHALWKFLFPRRFTFEGVTFVAKTVTLFPRTGNIRKREIIPRWVRVKPLKRVVLNAMGLPNRGIAECLDGFRWQDRATPFFLSFSSVRESRSERMVELSTFCHHLGQASWSFRSPIGLQLNFSCPNTGHSLTELESEIIEALGIAGTLTTPIVLKTNALMQPKTAAEISEHPSLDGFCVSNTIPWGQLPDRIDWKELFGSDVSPLQRFGGGGLSGAPLLQIVADWVTGARNAGVRKHINAGGGILHRYDVRLLKAAGADSVSIGSVAILRPWRLRSIIREAYQVFASS